MYNFKLDYSTFKANKSELKFSADTMECKTDECCILLIHLRNRWKMKNRQTSLNFVSEKDKKKKCEQRQICAI